MDHEGDGFLPFLKHSELLDIAQGFLCAAEHVYFESFNT